MRTGRRRAGARKPCEQYVKNEGKNETHDENTFGSNEG